jgi:DNA transformation protein
MAVKEQYLRWVLEQLSGAERVTSRRMFGGIGLYRDEVFFAIISADTLFFKVDAVNRSDYETRGMAPFRPFRDRPHLSMNYYEVPADVLEDAEECVRWALRAVAAGVAKKAAGAAQKKSLRKRVRPR